MAVIHCITEWAMPSRHTFTIPPIKEFVERWITAHKAVRGPYFRRSVIVDPFCGQSKYATHSNDLAYGGVDAEEYCVKLLDKGVRADVVIFDPPYSNRQISECYKEIGRKCTQADTRNASLYKRVREPLAKLLKPDGIALSFGWQSAGFGKEWDTLELLIVQHGGAHTDTMCVAQRRKQLTLEATP